MHKSRPRVFLKMNIELILR